MALILLVHAELCAVALSLIAGVAWVLRSRRALARSQWRRYFLFPVVTATSWAALVSWYVGPSIHSWIVAIRFAATQFFVAGAVLIPIALLVGVLATLAMTGLWMRWRWFRLANIVLLLALLLVSTPTVEALKRACLRTRAERRARLGKDTGKRIEGCVLIVVDALRYDGLSCTGSVRVRTPTFDRMARDGVLFTQSISQAPWTQPSIGSLMTSQYPSIHRAGGAGEGLARNLPTLAECLSEAGWDTAAFVTNDLLDPSFGFGRGFKRYEMRYDFRPYMKGSPVALLWGSWPQRFFRPTPRDEMDCRKCVDRIALKHAAEWLASEARSPFFAWIHLSAVLDYIYFYAVQVGPDGQPAPLRPNSDVGVPQERLRTISVGSPKDRWFGSNLRDWRARYESNIVYEDTIVSTFIDTLRSLGVLNRVLLIVTADHGEEFKEHGRRGHGQSLYDELIRVPLILTCPCCLPGGRVVSAQVRTIDVMPTVLDLAGISWRTPLRGRSLRELVESSSPNERVAYSEFDAKFSLESVRTARRKMIVKNQGEALELYDLTADPGEKTNIADSRPRDLTSMRERYTRWRLAIREQQGEVCRTRAKVNADLRDRMKALGYIVQENGRIQPPTPDRQPNPHPRNGGN